MKIKNHSRFKQTSAIIFFFSRWKVGLHLINWKLKPKYLEKPTCNKSVGIVTFRCCQYFCYLL